MKIAKILAAIVFAGALAMWIFGSIWSPILQVQTLTPQHSFGDTLELTTTVYNIAPFEKNIPISDNSAVPVLLIDGQEPPVVDHTSISGSASFAPLSNKTITTKVVLTQSSNDAKQPQLIGTDASSLVVTPGTHTVEVAWGGHVSQQISFTVN